MSKRSERNAASAKAVEDALRGEGRHFEADAIARLRRSLACSTGTNRVLYRDNVALRARLGLPSLLESLAAGRDSAQVEAVAHD